MALPHLNTCIMRFIKSRLVLRVIFSPHTNSVPIEKLSKGPDIGEMYRLLLSNKVGLENLSCACNQNGFLHIDRMDVYALELKTGVSCVCKVAASH